MELVSKEKCCGCRVCSVACPYQAISVGMDKYGFEQIRINEELCIGCGKCQSVCPILNIVKSEEHYSCGSAYAISEKVKMSGSSGGVFGVFAEKIIEEGGMVYGAAFDENLKLCTVQATTLEELIPLYKSKYLLCDIRNVFVEIKAILNKGKCVLYCSSPCQVAALRQFLGKDYEKLILIDFVCHGVGSQSLFDKSIQYVEKKKGIKIINFDFRHKKAKASSHYYYNYYYCKKNRNCVKSDIYLRFPYYYAYTQSIAYREGCYQCPYADEYRPGDITIGDFHAIDKYESKIDRFSGVSMFVCNSEKGYKFFESVEERLKVTYYEWETLKKNNRFCGGEDMPIKRKAFMDMIAKGEFKKAVRKYLNPYKDWRMTYYHLPKWLREFGRKAFGG